MGVVLKEDTCEFVLDADYEINFIKLSEIEKEHTHRFVELVYTTRGCGLHKIDDKEYHVKGGDMLIINYRCRHTVIPIENLEYVDIMVKPEYINKTLCGTEDLFLILQLHDFSDLANKVIRDNLLLHFDAEDQKKIEFLLSWTEQEQKRELPAKNLILLSALSMILIMVFRKMSENQRYKLAINDHLLSYIDRNCNIKLQISEIASMCGYTSEHFCRSFKKYTGKTPMEYLWEARIRKAKELLLKTDKSIEIICWESGFSNRTHFFKKFYETEGITPLQYKKYQK